MTQLQLDITGKPWPTARLSKLVLSVLRSGGWWVANEVQDVLWEAGLYHSETSIAARMRELMFRHNILGLKRRMRKGTKQKEYSVQG